MKITIKERNRVKRLAKKWLITLGETYRQYRNKLTSVLRPTKNKYYKDILKENQGNPRGQWETINSIFGGTRSIVNKHTVNKHTIACSDVPSTFIETFKGQ